MGLRPSVKSEENNTNMKNSSSNASENQNESTTTTTTSSPQQPLQREAWTVRGQLLLNFHDAISRAINSPEMMRKCAQIAEDMSRSEEPTSSTLSGGNHHDSVTNQEVASRNEITTTHSQYHNASSSMAEEYAAEAALIVENKEKRDAAVLNKSLALGLCSFVTLRGGRGLSSWMRKTLAGRASRPYQFDVSASSSSLSSVSKTIQATTKATASNTVPTNPQQPKTSTIRKVFRLSLDITLSTTLTILSSTFLFLPKPSAYIEDMSKLPLVEGKSVYAEMVCPPLLKEYKRVLGQYGGRWPVTMIGSSSLSSSDDGGDNEKRMQQKQQQQQQQQKGELTQEDVSLNIIRTFVENCSKRSKYERALAEERNAFNLQSSSRSNSAADNQEQTSSYGAVSSLMRRLTQRRDNTSTKDDKNKNNNNNNKKLGTVSIPSPGVPENISVNVDQDVYTLVSEDELLMEENNGERQNRYNE